VLSNIPELVEHFCMLGHHAKHLNHAFAPQVLAHLELSNRHVINFSFVGSIVKGNLFHRQRERLIKELVQSTNLEIFSDISHPSSYKICLHQMLYDAVHILQKLPFTAKMISAIPKVHRYAKLQERPSRSHYVDAAIAKRKNPPLFGIEMFQMLYQSQVALNTHIDISPHSASNMRLFEVTGVGTCLLTDWKENLSHVFEPEQEVVTYRSPEECIEKVKWLFEHPKAREAIARAGQARTLRDHTFAQRAAQLDEIIKSDFI
jgi:spore maturation protein CgeB